MFITIVVVFVLCHSLKFVLTFYEAAVMLVEGRLDALPDWPQHLSAVNHVLLAANSATNFVVYCWKDGKFRAAIARRVRRQLSRDQLCRLYSK